MTILKSTQIDKWNKDGYFKLNQLFDDNLIGKISSYVNDIIAWPDVEDKWMRWYEKKSNHSKAVCRIENFLDYHNELNNILLKNNHIKNMVEELLGEEVILYKEKIIIKSSGGGGYVPHQDLYDLVGRQVHAIIMIAIDPSTKANGCVKYARNEKHKKGIIARDEKGQILSEIYKKYEWESMECHPGDAIVFDNYTPHYSEPNTTSGVRRALFLAYHKASVSGFTREEYYQNKRKTNPPEPSNPDINNLKPSCTIMYEKE